MNIFKSIGKALRDVAIVAGSAGAVVALTAIQEDPAVLVAFAAIGPAGPIVALVVALAARAGIDAIKHRNG
jgi:alpha-beta hydrolase superfamily lysophospholipase